MKENTTNTNLNAFDAKLPNGPTVPSTPEAAREVERKQIDLAATEEIKKGLLKTLFAKRYPKVYRRRVTKGACGKCKSIPKNYY